MRKAEHLKWKNLILLSGNIGSWDLVISISCRDFVLFKMMFTLLSSGDGNAMIYRERLKEEGSGSGGGLKRSHSSPNIAKMIQDEEDASRKMQQTPQQQQPQVDRTVKPK